MKAALLQFLSGKSGRLKSLAITCAVMVATKVFAHYKLTLDEETVNLISLAVGSAVGGAIEFIVGYATATGVEDIQQQLRRVEPSVVVDGFPGPVTKEAAKTAADTSTLTPDQP